MILVQSWATEIKTFEYFVYQLLFLEQPKKEQHFKMTIFSTKHVIYQIWALLNMSKKVWQLTDVIIKG